MPQKIFRLRFWRLVLIGTVITSFVFAQAPSDSVSQIVVLYNSTGDDTTAFAELNRDLGPLIVSAQKKQVRIVYFDTAKLRPTDWRESIKIPEKVNTELVKILGRRKLIGWSAGG